MHKPALKLSALCTDWMPREHFNYSTLLTKFSLRACERDGCWAIWFAAWAVKSWPTTTIKASKNRKFGLRQQQYAAVESGRMAKGECMPPVSRHFVKITWGNELWSNGHQRCPIQLSNYILPSRHATTMFSPSYTIIPRTLSFFKANYHLGDNMPWIHASIKLGPCYGYRFSWDHGPNW